MNQSTIEMLVLFVPMIAIILLILPMFSFSKQQEKLVSRHIEENIERMKKWR